MSSVKDLLRGDVVDGSGTANNVAKWSDADTITDSVITDNGTTVTVTGALTVTSDASVNSLTVGRGAGNILTNTTFGFSALLSNTTGSINTALGETAMNANTTGIENVAVGRQALFFNTTGSNNIAVGVNSLLLNTTASNNIAVGRRALDANTTGPDNVAVGINALGANTTGDGNTAIGTNAGSNITTGNYNTIIGTQAQLAANDNSSSIVISAGGFGATGKGGSTGFIQPGGGGVFQGNNSANWSTTSDERLKKNIVDNNDGLDKITSIQVRNFEYRKPEEIIELSPSDAIKKEGVQLGVIAQELQQVLPECVRQESTGVYSLETDNLMWYMINAIKELKAEIELLKAK